VWTAIRFTPVVTAAACLVTGSVGVWLTITDTGPIAAIPDPVNRAAVAQVFVVVLMVLGMVISLSRRQVLDSVASLARSEAANARRAHELDLVMANLDDGVAIVEKGGRILHANTALRTAFGTQEENTELDHVRDDSEIPDEERLLRGRDGVKLTEAISPLTLALDGVAVPAEEWRAPSEDGPIRWVTISGVPLPPDEGGTPRAMVVLRDISGEKAHQEALETRAAELNLVIDNLNDGLAIVEEGGRYTQANDALRTIFWGTPDAIEASGDIDAPAAYHIFHPDGRPLREDEFPYRRALEGESVRDEEQYLRRPDSPTQILSVSAFPLPSDPGQKRRAMVVVRDITLERSYQDSLANFAGTVAHDLNNPLSVIDGWAEAIQEDLAESADPVAQGAASAVDHIRGGVEQMRSFISDLLAHAVARDQTLRCEAVPLRNIIKHIAVQRDRPDLPSGGIVFGDLPDVWADRLLVRQVLDNLLSNALKYVDPGVVPEVRVEAARVDDGWVQVVVRDNGIGIDPGQRERVFDSFHRASRDGYSGTGLGLAICKRIVERHGGTIRVDGNPGGGSVFVFTLPATPEAFAAATQV
jgi:PAS domain S-box-containing protein